MAWNKPLQMKISVHLKAVMIWSDLKYLGFEIIAHKACINCALKAMNWWRWCPSSLFCQYLSASWICPAASKNYHSQTIVAGDKGSLIRFQTCLSRRLKTVTCLKLPVPEAAMLTPFYSQQPAPSVLSCFHPLFAGCCKGSPTMFVLNSPVCSGALHEQCHILFLCSSWGGGGGKGSRGIGDLLPFLFHLHLITLCVALYHSNEARTALCGTGKVPALWAFFS